MAAHGMKRARPAELVPGTVSVITARLDYLPRATRGRLAGDRVGQRSTIRRRRPSRSMPAAATITRCCASACAQLAERIAEAIGPFGHRVFTDSAPVLEVELAARSGIGWRGKHTLVLDRDAGSMFFLGEIFVDVAAAARASRSSDHCGSCTACIDVCPTRAIVAPYELDARRCISYLTIEHEGPIPVEFRAAIGNRIYGCDDCQLVCPWNKFASASPLADFDVRPALDGPRCSRSGPGARTSSCAPPRAAPSAASASSAGSATSRSRSAMRSRASADAAIVARAARAARRGRRARARAHRLGAGAGGAGRRRRRRRHDEPALDRRRRTRRRRPRPASPRSTASATRSGSRKASPPTRSPPIGAT